MKNLSIYTTSCRGGAPKQSKQGRVSVYSGNSRVLAVDNYKGHSDNYTQREEPIIVIYDGLDSPNENVIFEGTQAQLVERLRK